MSADAGDNGQGDASTTPRAKHPRCSFLTNDSFKVLINMSLHPTWNEANIPDYINTLINVDQCGKCRAGTKRLNLNKFCKRDYAILGKVLEREIVEDWVRFSMSIQSVYKRAPESRLRRGNIHIWVHSKDLACKCPKIKSNKSYLILGKEKEGQEEGPGPGLIMSQRSIVIEWKEDWNNRMRRFQRRSRQCE